MKLNHFKGKQFQKDVIVVGYYLRYNLSYREVQEILYDRGINVSHTIHGKWKKLISRLKGVGIICIVPLIGSAFKRLRKAVYTSKQSTGLLNISII